jgi:hypothetical protein
MAIKKTVRYEIQLTPNTVIKKNMEFEFLPNQRPNTFQIRNYSTQTLFIGFNSSLSTSNFEVKIDGGSTRVVTILDKQVTEIYFLINDTSKLVLNASYSDEVYNNDLDQSQVISFISVGEVKLTNGTDSLTINADGSIDTNVLTLPNTYESNITSIKNSTALLPDIKTSLDTLDNTVYNDKVGTIEAAHKKIHSGDSYTLYYNFPAVANNGYARIRILAGATYKNHFMIDAHGSAGKHFFKLFTDTTYSSNGTVLTIHNDNFSSVKTCGSLAYHTPTINVLGTEKIGLYIADGNNPNERILSGFGQRQERIQNTNQDILIEMQNLSGGTSDINIVISFYED